MLDRFAEYWGMITEGRAGDFVRAGLIVVVGLVIARLVARRLRARLATHQLHLLARFASGAIVAVTLAWALSELGLNLGVLLGAAGVLTLAIGFASQTSVSNVISGVFLMSERPFVPGDMIRIGETMGEVLSIDLLSIKLRTVDNLLVRIPNEAMLRSNVTNMSHFPIRRFDLQVGVAYKEDLASVREAFIEVADRDPLVLEEPEPLVIFQSFGDSGINLQFSVWTARENLMKVRNQVSEQLKRAFDERGIEIPFPHRSLYAGEATAPLPVRLVGELSKPEGA